MLREFNFDGLPGPTHNYGGLSRGNLASMQHEGRVSNPKRAALEGLAKMRLVASLGARQAVMPPHERPNLTVLRRLGFRGKDEEVLARVAQDEPMLLRIASSASAMWTANAATVVSSVDSDDGLTHFVPANLVALVHRSIEAETTRRVLRSVFADSRSFVVHHPLPASGFFADEGAANHTRLEDSEGRGVHLFAWGRSAAGDSVEPTRFAARQTREASRALARLHRLDPGRTLFPQQHPEGIDGGAFHTDVLAVGSRELLMTHELAFAGGRTFANDLRELLGVAARVQLCTASEMPVADAVASYVFNSQLVERADGTLVVLAPEESRTVATARAFLDRVVAGDNRVDQVHYLDLRQSMHNGGGPACLRLRVPLTDEETSRLRARVVWTRDLDEELVDWVEKHYRDRLLPADLADPSLMRESMTALDELTKILGLGSPYDFQR